MHRRTVLMGLAASAVTVCLPTVSARAATLNLLATTYPVYQLVRNIVQGVNGVKVNLLIPAGTGCPHDYAPSPADMQKLTRASAVILNGLGMEAMLVENIRRLNLPMILASVDVATLPSLMKDPHDESDHGQTHALNPHIFAAPSRAAQMTRSIAVQLGKLVPRHAAAFAANASAYAERLDGLAARLKNAGLLSYRWEESPQGPPRKYYSITEQGKQTLELLENSWRELTASIERLKTFSQQNSTEAL